MAEPQHGHSAPRPMTAGEEQGWGVAMHLGGLVLSWLVPVVLWLVFRERSRMLDDHGKEAVNWQITFFIFYVISVVLMLVLVGFVLLPLLYIVNVIFSILAALAAYRRQPFRYPFAIRLLK